MLSMTQQGRLSGMLPIMDKWMNWDGGLSVFSFILEFTLGKDQRSIKLYDSLLLY
jgi:hypothetical protein